MRRRGNGYTILELALKTDGDCLPMIPTVADTTADPISCTVNGKPYTCTIIADRGVWSASRMLRCRWCRGITVSGTAVSLNDTDNAEYLLYNGSTSDTDIKAEWKAGTYTKALTDTPVERRCTANRTANDTIKPFSFGAVTPGSYKLAIFKPGKYVPEDRSHHRWLDRLRLRPALLWLYGDVNYDGKVLANDAHWVNRYKW